MVFGETVHNQMLALSLAASMGLEHGLCITHLVLRPSVEGEPGMDQGREWEGGGRWMDGGGLLSSFAHYLLPRSLAGITRVTTPVNPTDRPRPTRHATPAVFFIHLTQIRIWEPGGGLQWRPPDF